MKKRTFIGLLFCSIGLYCAQSFVVTKQEKQKKESRSQLKERVCQLLYSVLNGFSDLLGSLSSAQRSMLEAVADFIASEKKNIIDSATEQELKKLIAELEEITKATKNLETKLQILVPYLSKK